eukprot:jgi/Chlat1/6591/Chrsp46S06098
MLKPRGKLCQIGISSKKEPFNVTEFNMCYYERQIIGIWVGSRKQTRDMLKFAAEHNILPVIDEEIPLDKVNDGIAKVSKSQAKFRVVLRPDLYAKERGLPHSGATREPPAGEKPSGGGGGGDKPAGHEGPPTTESSLRSEKK